MSAPDPILHAIPADLGATAIGIANIALDGTVLDTWFPHPTMLSAAEVHDGGHVAGTTRLGAHALSSKMLSLVKLDEDRMIEQVAVRTTISSLAEPPLDAHDVYLRLHLLSHRLARPQEINMEGMFNLLQTVVWTNKGPCMPDNFEFVRTSLRSRGLIHVYAIDKLPRMVDYVVPSGVQIAEAERVRLGAYLAPGTRVLREGFVSVNSGSFGAAKIEGRLSYGIMVGEGTRVGLSATLMAPRDNHGTRIPMSIGKNCTLGVSSGLLGVRFGDNCSLGNNVVIDADTPLLFSDDGTCGDRAGQVLPASVLSGESNWSVAVEAGASTPVVRPVPA